MKTRGGRKEKHGGKQGQNYYIFCPKARTAPFVELRDRDSAARLRVAKVFVGFD